MESQLKGRYESQEISHLEPKQRDREGERERFLISVTLQFSLKLELEGNDEAGQLVYNSVQLVK